MTWAKTIGQAELPQGKAKDEAVRQMFDTIAPRYELCNRILTLNLDNRWRQAAVKALEIEQGSYVLDLASGTGDFVRALAAAGHHSVAADFSANMLAQARGEHPRIQGDAAELPIRDGVFDAATCGFALRNFSDLRAVISELARVLRPGGRVALLDVATPNNPLLSAGHRIWFGQVVPLVGGVLSDKTAYSYLPRSVTYLPSQGEFSCLLKEHGFLSVMHRELSGGITQLFTATKSAAQPRIAKS